MMCQIKKEIQVQVRVCDLQFCRSTHLATATGQRQALVFTGKIILLDKLAVAESSNFLEM